MDTAPFPAEPPLDPPGPDPLVRELGLRLVAQPYQTLLVAAGVGYLLGGGLFTPLTARVVAMGLRAAIVPLVQLGLESAARDVLGAAPHGEAT